MAHNNTLSVAISRDEDAQHDLVLSFGTKGTIISGLSEADLLEIRSAINCATVAMVPDTLTSWRENARLIAAAPDLLALLAEAEKILADCDDRDELVEDEIDTLKSIRAAIAKATGGAR